MSGVTVQDGGPGQAGGKARLSGVQATRKLVLTVGLAVIVLLIAFSDGVGIGGFSHDAVERLGQVLLGLCIVGRAWCSFYIGGRKNQELIVTGPYSVVRNPLYFFSFLGAFGAGAQSDSLAVALLTTAVCILVFWMVVLKEEATLVRLMGAPYQAYLARTPRFLPNPLLWRAGEALRPDLKRVGMTVADGAAFLLAIPLCEGLERLQQMGWLPVLLRLP
ncbi:MAG: isoprenylcysteine carboxylmethyltransferase family protein [Caulobacteraceae bacterium]|nr:isoprenylcysteine carboxylmethyltransferase family protein [Caulobacteraceae bacterium]